MIVYSVNGDLQTDFHERFLVVAAPIFLLPGVCLIVANGLLPPKCKLLVDQESLLDVVLPSDTLPLPYTVEQERQEQKLELLEACCAASIFVEGYTWSDTT